MKDTFFTEDEIREIKRVFPRVEGFMQRLEWLEARVEKLVEKYNDHCHGTTEGTCEMGRIDGYDTNAPNKEDRFNE